MLTLTESKQMIVFEDLRQATNEQGADLGRARAVLRVLVPPSMCVIRAPCERLPPDACVSWCAGA